MLIINIYINMEIWVEINGYNGMYQISDKGNIKTNNYKRTGQVKLLKQCNHNTGYKYVNLCNNGLCTPVLCHRLVGQAFLGLDITNSDMFVCHINDIKTDNRVENLFLGTHQDNIDDMNNKRRHGMVGKFGKDCLSSKKVNQYTKDGDFIKTRDSLKEASIGVGLNTSTGIVKVCKGIRDMSGGYKWEYFNK